MNLMFRKNFTEQKCGAAIGKPVKASGSRHASKRSSREQGYTPIDEHHYRTHLFFSPQRSGYRMEDCDGNVASWRACASSWICVRKCCGVKL